MPDLAERVYVGVRANPDETMAVIPRSVKRVSGTCLMAARSLSGECGSGRRAR